MVVLTLAIDYMGVLLTATKIISRNINFYRGIICARVDGNQFLRIMRVLSVGNKF